MPDTRENQTAYPQPNSQKTGCGFPIAKICVLFSLATGAAIALVINVLNTHDVKLARRLYEFLNPGDVLLGDRAFCTYADIVFLKNRGCDGVFRKHPSGFAVATTGGTLRSRHNGGNPRNALLTYRNRKILSQFQNGSFLGTSRADIEHNLITAQQPDS